MSHFIIPLPACLPIYGFTTLCWALATFSVSLSFMQPVALLERGINPSQGRYLHTGHHKHKINAHKHSCLKWDSNPRSQCLIGEDSPRLRPRGRPLWSVSIICTVWNTDRSVHRTLALTLNYTLCSSGTLWSVSIICTIWNRESSVHRTLALTLSYTLYSSGTVYRRETPQTLPQKSCSFYLFVVHPTALSVAQTT
jgi:hypothetical protein